MPRQTKLLDDVLGKLEGGELIKLPADAHVSSKGGLWIDSDKLYKDEDFTKAVEHAERLLDAVEGNKSAG